MVKAKSRYRLLSVSKLLSAGCRPVTAYGFSDISICVQIYSKSFKKENVLIVFFHRTSRKCLEELDITIAQSHHSVLTLFPSLWATGLLQHEDQGQTRRKEMSDCRILHVKYWSIAAKVLNYFLQSIQKPRTRQRRTGTGVLE